MSSYFIKASHVEDGMFANERIVSLNVEGARVTLIVDRGDVMNEKLRVNVLQRGHERVLIDLPREPIAGSSRMVIPASLLSRE